MGESTNPFDIDDSEEITVDFGKENINRIKVNRRCFAYVLLQAKRQLTDKCDEELPFTNAPPVHPGARMIARLRDLVNCASFDILCQYVDSDRDEGDRVVLIAEHYSNEAQCSVDFYKPDQVICWVRQLLNAVYFIHKNFNHCVGIIRDSSICYVNQYLTNCLRIKLCNWALPYVSDNGRFIDFSYFHPCWAAPEQINYSELSILDRNRSCTFATDAWQIGLVILQKYAPSLRKYFTRNEPNPICDKLSIAIEKETWHPLITDDERRRIPIEIVDILDSLLAIKPENRSPLHLILSKLPHCASHMDFTTTCDLRNVKIDYHKELVRQNHSTYDPFRDRPITEVYALWKLCGSCVAAILRHQNVVIDQHSKLNFKQLEPVLILEPKLLPITGLLEKTEQLRCGKWLPHQLGLSSRQVERQYLAHCQKYQHLSATVREQNPDILYYEQVIFNRLYDICNKQLPAGQARDNQSKLKSLIYTIVPTAYRAKAWASLLGVSKPDEHLISTFDPKQPHKSDRQLDLDVPRCHQYDDLLSTPEAHVKLKRVIKMYLHADRADYWQGLDSVIAPFVYLYWHDEYLAATCAKAFVNRFLNGIFTDSKTNNVTIHRHFAIFTFVLAYHYPVLYAHLRRINFYPDLYTVGWFLSMFAHDFSLHKIMHVWDAALTSNCQSYMTFLACSIVNILKKRLLKADFSECTQIIQKLPILNHDSLIADTQKLLKSTPPSIVRLDQQPLTSLKQMIGLSHNNCKDARSCGILSFDDLLLLVDGHPDWGPLMLVDVRPTEERTRTIRKLDHLHTINVPYTEEFLANAQEPLFIHEDMYRFIDVEPPTLNQLLPPSPGVDAIMVSRHKLPSIVLVDRSRLVPHFALHAARSLQVCGYERVSILEDGFESIVKCNYILSMKNIDI